MRRILLILTFIGTWGLASAQESPRVLYALNSLAQTISKVNLETGVIENDILSVGSVPNRITARGDRIYVVNSIPPGITVISRATDEIVLQIALGDGENPWAMAFAGPNQGYVSNLIANTVSVVNLENGNLIDTIPVGTAPEGLLVMNSHLYVTNTGGYPDYSPSTVSVIDIQTNAVIKTLTVGTNPQDLAQAPDGKIHVICTGDYGAKTGKAYIIDPVGDTDQTPAVVDSVQLGGTPGDIAINAGGRVIIPDFGDGVSGFVYEYDALTREVRYDFGNPMRIGGGAMNVFYDPEYDELFINNFLDDAVQLIDSDHDSVLMTYPVGDGVVDMVVAGPVPSTTAVDMRPSKPAKFELYQNYPNPFNPSTKINFSVQSQVAVKIRIFDVRGRQLTTLIDKVHSPGNYFIEWNGTSDSGEVMPSGVYFYEMLVGGNREAKRLVLIR